MKALANLLAVIAIFAGLGLAFLAFTTTGIISSNPNASAVQITQVYSEATFYGVLSLSAFAFAIAVLIGNAISAIGKNTEAIQYYGNIQKDTKSESPKAYNQ